MKKSIQFKKGQSYNVKYSVSEGKGIRSTNRDIIGTYEIIRMGRRFYLFDNANGIDWNPTKQELQQAIDNYKK